MSLLKVRRLTPLATMSLCCSSNSIRLLGSRPSATRLPIKVITRGLASSSSNRGLLDKLMRRSMVSATYPDSPEYHDHVREMLEQPVAIYTGFDATANSLHVGHLAILMISLQFQRHGHQVIFVEGDATTRVGDPSGRTKDRPKIKEETINENLIGIRENLRRIVYNHKNYIFKDKAKCKEPIIVRNSSWYDGRTCFELLDEFSHIRISKLLHKRLVQDRLKEHDMSLTEFMYQAFQAYDWWQLYQRHNCKFQIGGTDQAGNIYTGHDYIRRVASKKDAVGLLVPLITTDSGQKLGKSVRDASKNIWLSPQRTSPFELYQHFVRTPDTKVEQYLKVFTFYDDETIEDLIQNHLKKPVDVWYCQKKLAEQVCLLVHGESGLQSAKRLTAALYNRNPHEIANLTDSELDELFDEKSIIRLVHRSEMRVLDLIRRADCFNSDAEAESLISAGGLLLNGAQVTSINVPVSEDLIIGNGVTVMRVGKKNYYLFKWIS